VRAWCVEVPREKGEDVRRALRDRGLLLPHLRIRREAGSLLIPTAARADVGFPTLEADFEEGFTPVRSYKPLVRVPDEFRPLLPTSLDVIGDIAVLRMPEALVGWRHEIGRAVLAWDPRIRVVAHDRGVAGDARVRRVEIVAGEARTTTIHVEFGLRYRVDIARAYFSPRLVTERKRIADLVGRGEVVADPFAGVGPYAILIARRSAASRVVASDANADAIRLLRANVAANRADRVEVREGDARDILRATAPVDRVVLDLPHAAMAFVPDALRALGTRGTIHVYGFLEASEREERMEDLRALVAREGRGVEGVRLHEVRAYSPSQRHVAFDVTVGPT
jgi:tRNA (guanine37-N1)-methyltransferase